MPSIPVPLTTYRKLEGGDGGAVVELEAGMGAAGEYGGGTGALESSSLGSVARSGPVRSFCLFRQNRGPGPGLDHVRPTRTGPGPQSGPGPKSGPGPVLSLARH